MEKDKALRRKQTRKRRSPYLCNPRASWPCKGRYTPKKTLQQPTSYSNNTALPRQDSGEGENWGAGKLTGHYVSAKGAEEKLLLADKKRRNGMDSQSGELIGLHDQQGDRHQQFQIDNTEATFTRGQVQELLKYTHDLIVIFRLTDQWCLYANESWCQALGYSEAEAKTLYLWELVRSAERAKVSRITEILLKGESIEEIELTFSTRSGDLVWAIGKILCQKENGQPYSGACIFRNITAEKLFQAKYEQIFDNTREGLFEASLAGDVKVVNQSMATIYGYDSPAEFIEKVKNVSKLYVRLEHWQECIADLELKGEILQEVKVIKHGGTAIWVSERLRLTRSAQGQATGVEGFVQDISNQRQAEATLEVAKEQLQAVLDAVPGTVSLISSNFRYLGVNRHLAATYNMPLEHFVGREVGFRQGVFGKFVRDFFTNDVEEASIEIDAELDGAFRSDMVIAKKWLDNEAAVFVGIDITERKRAEAALQAEFAEAAEYVRSLLPAPITEPVAIDSRFIPSQQLGGDGFDYYWLDDDHLAVYLLDVSGHGSRAALLSVSVLNLLRSRFLPNTNFYQPNEVLAALNQLIQMDRQRNMYFTIWYGVYNQKERQLVYASAGHPPALLLFGSSDNVQVKQLRTSGCLPIGMFPTAQYVNDSCEIEDTSTLYVFSDGIYEIRLPDGTVWDLNDFLQLLRDCHRTGKAFSLEPILDAVRSLKAKETFEDDVSLLEVNFS
ncbi:MAG: SpoIIE family protein phosphatase [Oscillatoria sp. SIO1A7]|nr:SpoIIE family protein phosphatase [Oscillatoria sp. SIO1A7]